ncbi:phasin family protein [Halomonas dongshanensis]|uniref:Phasin family protein n=1 Tax=Halomonas dongshanensis TaxID=2890835 RepID=A0ABT2EDZ1_9GAMM|nr:phasin family protein [Halomonas dongshanensis]MCS2609811.1 phasin family protein [Halomonas dongshanensis]
MNGSAEKTSQQFDAIFVSPMRSYTRAALDYVDQLTHAQLDAARAYTDMTLTQARTWLDVKDVDSFKRAVESQQKTASNLMERVKGDTEKMSSLSQSFIQDSQKSVEESANKAKSAASQATTAA